MLKSKICFVMFLVACCSCGSTKNQFLKNDCLLEKPALLNNNLSTENIIGYSNSKNLFYNGTNPSHLDVMIGSRKIGRFSFSPKVEKIKINNSSIFLSFCKFKPGPNQGTI
ncbi:MAG: hypothetical protein H6690_02555 [Erysipelotrichaceae bacterium]|nr:hypothetical protein [Erysipelotrichaceae bacterium]